MKNLYLFLVLICFEVSCTGQNQKAGERPIESSNYIFENDTIIQKATISFKDKSQIHFSISTFNRKRNVENTFSDTAKVRSTPNTDNVQAYDDEVEGDMYPAIEYIYNTKFYLSIGIDSSNKGRLFILEADGSEKYHEKYCPFSSIGTLRKVK